MMTKDRMNLFALAHRKAVKGDLDGAIDLTERALAAFEAQERRKARRRTLSIIPLVAVAFYALTFVVLVNEGYGG